MIVIFQGQVAFSQRACSRAPLVSDPDGINEQVSIDLYDLVVICAWFLGRNFDWTERDQDDSNAHDSQ